LEPKGEGDGVEEEDAMAMDDLEEDGSEYHERKHMLEKIKRGCLSWLAQMRVNIALRLNRLQETVYNLVLRNLV
jgi:hypothetical protein